MQHINISGHVSLMTILTEIHDEVANHDTRFDTQPIPVGHMFGSRETVIADLSDNVEIKKLWGLKEYYDGQYQMQLMRQEAFGTPGVSIEVAFMTQMKRRIFNELLWDLARRIAGKAVAMVGLREGFKLVEIPISVLEEMAQGEKMPDRGGLLN